MLAAKQMPQWAPKHAPAIRGFEDMPLLASFCPGYGEVNVGVLRVYYTIDDEGLEVTHAEHVIDGEHKPKALSSEDCRALAAEFTSLMKSGDLG